MLALLLAACGGRDDVRKAGGPYPPPAPPPPPLSAGSVCPGATGTTDYAVPSFLCESGKLRECHCGEHASFSFCLGNAYYYEYDLEVWLTVCP